MFLVKIVGNEATLVDQLVTKRGTPRHNRLPATSTADRLILNEYRRDRWMWNRYEKSQRRYYSRRWPKFFRSESIAKYRKSMYQRRKTPGWLRYTKLDASPIGLKERMGDGKCCRCNKRVSTDDLYCDRCLEEVVPVTTPLVKTLIRYRRQYLEEENPGFENVIRAIEDG